MNVESDKQLREIKMELTDACHLRCKHCSSNASRRGTTTIPKDKCIEILNDAAGLGVKEVTFSGGEPLLYKHLLNIVQYSKQYGMKVAIYTTGNVPDFGSLMEQLKNVGVEKIVFNLFSGTAKGHEAIAQCRGSFTTTCDSIAIAVSQNFREVELHFVPLASNYRELETVADLGVKLGATRISVLRFVPQGRGKHLAGEVLTAAQNEELRQSIKRIDSKRPSGIRWGSPYNFLMLKEKPQCNSGIDRLTITPDLRIVPCDAFKQIRVESIVGPDKYSSLASATLPECWEKSAYLNTVRSYLTTAFPAECEACSALKKCHSGCLAQKFLAYGSLDKKRDPGCLMKQMTS